MCDSVIFNESKKGLEVQVYIEVDIDILVGLELTVFIDYSLVMEVFMTNSITLISNFIVCVWCGVAFLRRTGVILPTQQKMKYLLIV